MRHSATESESHSGSQLPLMITAATLYKPDPFPPLTSVQVVAIDTNNLTPLAG